MRHSRISLSALLVGIGALCVGCEPKWTVAMDTGTAEPVEILVNGKSIGKFAGPEVTFPVTQRQLAEPVLESCWECTVVSYRVTPRGCRSEEEISVRLEDHSKVPNGGTLRGEPDGFRRGEVPNEKRTDKKMVPRWIGFHTLFVDNRGGTTRKLMAGGLEYRIDPGKAERLIAPAFCKETQGMTLDGAPIGKLPLADPAAGRRYYFLDAAGNRCYRATTHTYSVNAALPGGVSRTYRKRYLHELERWVSFFLVPAPDKINHPAPVSTELELLEEPCDPG